MSITTKSGAVLTNDTLDKMAEEWEGDTWDGQLSEVVMGRPRISNEELVNVSFKVPKSRVAAIERLAKANGETKSDFLRHALDEALVKQIIGC